MITAKELAIKITGREYCEELTDEEIKEAFDANLIVVFGASDDRVELHGLLNDEAEVLDKTKILFKDGGLLKNNCIDEYCPYFKKILDSGDYKTLEVEGLPWVFKANFPIEKFKIMEDGELYGEGCVFHVDEIY